MSSGLNSTQPHHAGPHTINWQKFYAKVRKDVFGGRLPPKAFENIELICATWYKGEGKDYRHLCYMLATVLRECGRNMAPIEEFGKGAGKAYGRPHPTTGKVYYGRGHVQLTWYDNYLKMEKILGIPLTRKPELALAPKISAKIMFEGMYVGVSKTGDFTGHSLEEYFNASVEDPVNARRIVNGLDHAQEIANNYFKFKAAFLEAYMDPRLIMQGGQIAINMAKILAEQLEQRNIPAPAAKEIAQDTVDTVAAQPEVVEVQPPKKQTQSVTVAGAVVAMLASLITVYTGVELAQSETVQITAAVTGVIGAVGAGVAWWGRVRATRVIK